MYKERMMGVLSDQFINIIFQDVEFYQVVNYDVYYFISDFQNGSFWMIQVQVGFERFQYNVVDFMLGLGEFVVDWEGVGNIVSVIFVFVICVN